MRAFSFGLLLVGAVFTGPPAAASDRLDGLFSKWAEAQKDIRWLVVEFTLETWDSVWQECHQSVGTFKVLRTPKAMSFASYELRTMTPEAVKAGGLLNGGKIYFLDHDRKAALRFTPADGDVAAFLERHFNPFVVLLDSKQVKEKHRLEVVKQDKWYTYLAITPKVTPSDSGIHCIEARAVLMNRPTENVPKNMPRQLWYADGIREYTFRIRAWRLNAGKALDVKEFERPEDRPGWRVEDWPF